jgi:carboxypeptidase C (cathepsin A)
MGDNHKTARRTAMKKTWIAVCATIMMTSTLAVSVPKASADWFSRHHPRRAEVDHREERQQERIARGLHNGSLTPGEAQQLETQERALRNQERQEVRENGGFLTKQQTRRLNHEEDTISHKIHHDTHN